MTKIDPVAYNRESWDKRVAEGDRWTIPVSSAEIERARRGEFELGLTPAKRPPREWFGELEGARVLGLASGGGQQMPIFAASGASVTVLDNSPAQLERDREVALREGLEIRTELGVMADLSRFDDEAFDLIYHPVSNCFAPEIRPVWRECFRVLRPGGALLAGFVNPWWYMFDDESHERGELVIRHPRPYSDVASLSAEELEAKMAAGHSLEYAHSLEDQIGGQLDAGFLLAGYLDDTFPEMAATTYGPMFAATRALKPPAR